MSHDDRLHTTEGRRSPPIPPAAAVPCASGLTPSHARVALCVLHVLHEAARASSVWRPRAAQL
eukprot:gene12490-59767_t